MKPTRRSRALSRALKEIQHTGSQLIQDKKTAVRDECDVNGSGAVGRQDVGGHDLLSLLIKANITADMPESMRMNDTEILSREQIVPLPNVVFLTRSHDNNIYSRGAHIPDCRARNFKVKTKTLSTYIPTSDFGPFCCSTAVSWALFAFACHPTVQTKLRAELRTSCPATANSPTMEQLNSLPYLESVVREILRLYTPVSTTERIAMHDAEIPLQKPFMDKRGVLRGTIRYEITIISSSRVSKL